MPVTSPANLLKYLRDKELLDPGNLKAMESWLADSASLDDTLRELEQRKWLTPFQCQRLRDGEPLVLANFVLLDWLGKGGMGEVFKARHRTLNRLAAVKIIRNLLHDDQVKRFQREARAAAVLHHPNVVTIYDAGEDEGIHFLAMEYVEGIDLAKMLRAKGPLDVSLACYFLQQAAHGLQHAHEHGLIHRDIKPANLVITHIDGKQGPVLKILDFGLARFSHEADSELTPTGQWLGTPEFIAPEQACDSSRADIRSDIFSLGCVFYTALSGHAPFQGGNSVEKLAARFAGAAPELRTLRAEIPAELESIARKMLERDPSARFQTPAEVAASLEPWIGAAANTPDALAGLTRGMTSVQANDTIPFVSSPPTKTPSTQELTQNATTVAHDSAPPSTPRPRYLIGGAFAFFGLLVIAAVLLWRIPANQGQAKQDPPIVNDKNNQQVAQKNKDEKEKGEVKKVPEIPLLKHFANSIQMELVRVPAGTFMMGAEGEIGQEENETPRHEVVIAKEFYLGKFEVTQEEYLKVIRENPSHFSAKGEGRNKILDLPTDRHPVETVSWQMAQIFCNVLSDRPAEKEAGRVYRLPTEEQWEYACRAGTRVG